MIQIASSQLGCDTGNVNCYCQQPDFGYGVRDCAQEACEGDDDAQTVISFGQQYCQMAIDSYSSTASGGMPTASALSVLSSATGGAAGNNGQASSTATVT